MLHHARVLVAVDLRAQRVHRRAFTKVQHAALQRAFVRRFAHFAAERVHFAHKVALCCAADARVARAVAHSVHVYCEDHRAAAETRRGQSRLNSRVSRADHGNIVFSCIIAHNLTSFPIYSEIQLIPKIKYNNFDILFSHAELFKYLIDHRIRNTLSGQFI